MPVYIASVIFCKIRSKYQVFRMKKSPGLNPSTWLKASSPKTSTWSTGRTATTNWRHQEILSSFWSPWTGLSEITLHKLLNRTSYLLVPGQWWAFGRMVTLDGIWDHPVAWCLIKNVIVPIFSIRRDVKETTQGIIESLQSIMGGSGIVVYSIVGCPHCKAAKKRLHDENLQFLDVSVDK